MSSVTNILKCVSQLQRLAQDLESIAKQLTAEAQLAQDAQAREAEIREETRLFLERLGVQRKRSGSTNAEATTSRKTVALSAAQGGGQVRVAVSSEKPEMTTPCMTGFACQGLSGDEDTSAFPVYQTPKQPTTIPQAAKFLQGIQRIEKRNWL